MDATKFTWSEIDEDNPIALLTRKCIKGERMLVAEVKLMKGCHVAQHHHESEQIAIMLSGKVVWGIGEAGSPEYRKVPLSGGEVMVLPSHVVHSVDVLEDSVIVDVLTPIGPMGVDSQGRIS